MRGAAPGPLLVATLLSASSMATGCHRDTTLGPPDSFLLYAPADAQGGPAPKSPGGLPLLQPLPVDDARAVALYKQMAVGFPGEMVRTDYLAKQFLRDAAVPGHTAAAAARAAAREPTVIIVGAAPADQALGLATKGWFFGGAVEHPGVPWLALQEDPDHDAALPQTLAGLLARHVARRITGAAAVPSTAVPGAPAALEAPAALIEGYGRAMEVIAREWRVGDGPQGAIPLDAGTRAQRALFAGVRENQYALGADGKPRPAAELLADPGVAATVIYRLAQSQAVGRRVAPASVYAPFVSDRVPPGVSPAAVLGPFRNFQAKLLSAWGRAVVAGAPPRDIADLVEAYTRAMPAERWEALRLFVVTTYGATVKAGGVFAPGADAARILPELTALAAEVAAGQRSSREALKQ